MTTPNPLRPLSEVSAEIAAVTETARRLLASIGRAVDDGHPGDALDDMGVLGRSVAWLYALDVERAVAEAQRTTAAANLADLFEAKYAEARANGATDEQALTACRSLWLEALDAVDARRCGCRDCEQ